VADPAAYIPSFVVGDPMLADFIHASTNGMTPDNRDPWDYLSDKIKSHQGLVNPAVADTSMDQQEFGLLVAAGTGAGAAVGSMAAYPLLVLTGPLGWIAAAVLGGIAVQPRTCRVILVNNTDQDLIPDSDLCNDPDKLAWLDCGHVVAKPAVPQDTGKWLRIGVIPKRRVRADGTVMAGVGCYVFQKDNFALKGTGGVLPFQRWGKQPGDKGFQPALGWLVPQSGTNSTITTFDLDGDGKPQELYTKYVDRQRQVQSNSGRENLWFSAGLSFGHNDSATLTACIFTH
jgi:hypothetical protein